MGERTQRGDEDRRREDEQVAGEPAARTAPAGGTGVGGTNTTRDKGVNPADDNACHGDRDSNR
jgi:hypothetical protein